MNIWRMTRVSLSIWVCLALAGMISCTGDDPNTQPDPVAFVAMYHASANAPSLDVVVDGSQLNSETLDFGDYSGYLNFKPGNVKLQFGPFDTDDVLIDSTVTFEDQKLYSIFIIDENENSELLIHNDNPVAAAPGKAKIRFINLSPDVGLVSLNVEGENDPLISGKLFKEESDFIEVDPGKYDFTINSGNGDNIILQLPDTSLKATLFYTVIVRGYETPPGGNTHGLSAKIVVN
jgi:hypothetical protein